MRGNSYSPNFATSNADYVTVCVTTWLLVGVVIDGWAHQNRTLEETFFTPWHAIFYSGYFATLGWIAYLRIRRLRLHMGGAEPAYGLAEVGLLVFALGGVADLIWHTAYGIEVDVEALVSPPHLVLLCGTFIILSTPFRANAEAHRRGLSLSSGPATLSIALSTGLVGFFLQYLNPLLISSMTNVPYNEIRRADLTPALEEFFVRQVQIRGIASVLVTSAVLAIATSQALRLKGKFTLTTVYVIFGILMGAQNGYKIPFGIVALLIAGALGDVVRAGLQRLQYEFRLTVTIVAFVSSLTIGSGYFAALSMTFPIEWGPGLVGGSVVLASLISCLLAYFASSNQPDVVNRSGD